MKKTVLFLAAMVTSIVLLAQNVSLQGVLRDPAGKSVADGFYDVTFTIYDASTGGTALWSENYPSLQTRHGVFNVNLGTNTPLEPSLAFNQQYWVGVTVDPYAEMSPRLEITIYPYAKSILGQDNKFPSIGDVEMQNDDFIIHEGELRLQGTGGLIRFNDGTTLNTANFGGPAGSLANPTDAVINGDLDANGSGGISFQAGGVNHGYMTNSGVFLFGNDDTQAAEMNLLGGSADFGGLLRFYNGANHDDTDEYWYAQAYLGNFRIGTLTNNDHFRLNASGSADFSGQVTGSILQAGTNPAAPFVTTGTDNIQAYASAGNVSELRINPGGGRVAFGDVAGFHMFSDGNQLNARNGGAAATLELNPLGGVVSAPSGWLTFGIDDAQQGTLNLYGGAGASGGYLRLHTGATGDDGGVNEFQLYAQSDNLILDRTGLANLMVVDGATGNIGINDGTPTEGKLVVRGSGTGVDSWSVGHGYLDAFGATGYTSTTNNLTYDIYADGNIATLRVSVWSDARIKNVLAKSDNAEDLEKLKRIEIVDYEYIDKLAKGDKVQKKVLAQQVEEVLPDAISKVTEIIPSVFELAEKIEYNSYENSLKVTTAKSHEFKEGDLIRLIMEDGPVEKEVVTVTNENTFVVSSERNYDKVFVYGKQVDDFRNVDYDAISMLNVSATQELAKRVEALQKENEELKAKLSKVDELETKLNKLLGLEEPTKATQIGKQ